MADRTRAAVSLGVAWFLLSLEAFGIAGQRHPRMTQAAPKASVTAVAKLRPSVVSVFGTNDYTGDGSQGSGVIIRGDGLVVTAWHVVAGMTTVLVKTYDGGYYPVDGLLAWDRAADFALLKVQAKGLPAAKLGDSRRLRQGERVWVIASPLGLEQSVSDGIVSAVRSVASRGTLIQVTAPVSSGSSGGALANASGEVVGIVCGTLEEGQALNFAVPINTIKPCLAAKRKITTVSDLAQQLPVKARDSYWRGQDILERGRADLAEPSREAYQAALPLFREAAELDPTHDTYTFHVGYCLSGLGDYEGAITAYQRATELNPDDALHWGCVVEAYGNAGRWEDAVRWCRDAIILEEENAEARYALAVAYRGMGNRALAAQALAEALRLTRDNAWTASCVGDEYYSIGDVDGALASYDKAIEIEPEKLEPWFRMGSVYREEKRWREAVDMWQRMLRVSPDVWMAHEALGEAYNALGEHARAVSSLKEAVRLWPGYADAHCALGVAYSKLGDWRSALAEHQEAVKLDPGSGLFHRCLGEAYLRTGDRSKALEEYATLQLLDTALAAELFKLIYP